MKQFGLIVSALFGLLLIYSVALSGDDSLKKADEEIIADSLATIEINDAVVVYYFFQTKRCPSCRKIEEYTAETVTTRFKDSIDSGFVVWQPINVDLEGNEHYFDDYELFTKSVILSRVVNKKETEWVNLPKIWELLNSKEKFGEYIETEITSFMNKK